METRTTAARKEREIYITRHGMRLDWVKPDWHLETGEKQWDAPLSQEGLQQARELGQRLADVELDFIFSSPFLRCVQTADAVAAAQQQRWLLRPQGSARTDSDQHTAVPIFIEHALGEWDDGKRVRGRSAHELKVLFPRVDDSYASFIPLHEADNDESKSESVHELHVRCERFVEFVNRHDRFGAKDKCILFVGHAASTIAFYRAWMQDRTADFFPATCSLSKLVRVHDTTGTDIDCHNIVAEVPQRSSKSAEERRARWQVELWGDCSHLSKGQQRPWRFSLYHDQELATIKE